MRKLISLYRELSTLGVCWLLVNLPESAFAYAPDAWEGKGKRFSKACAKGFDYLSGGNFSLSSLLVAVAGVGAIISAAIGGFRMAWACVVVATGSFILKNFITGDGGATGKAIGWFTVGDCS